MNDGISTSSSIGDPDGARARALHWLLLGGNRLLVAGGVVLGVFVAFFVLATAGAIAVGPDSSAATVFGSGLVSGTLTVVTVALSINQLILSRVFGSPNEFRDRLDGTRDLRRLVQRRADEPVGPNDPAAFLSVIARALAGHARDLETTLGRDAPAAVADYASAVAAYGDAIDESVGERTDIVDVLDVILGTAYAENMTATEHVRNEYAGAISEAAGGKLVAIEDLLEAIAISRQFFKTILLQQDFARLSRILAYSGLVALLVSLGIGLAYRPSAAAIDPGYLPAVVSVGVAAILTPLAVFIAYVLRAATIAHRTVSVGPFVPPGEHSGGE